MAVAIVVCCRDRPALLELALDALRVPRRPGDELVVVDSASLSADVREVALAAGATVVRCDQPGASRARNAGAAATTAPILAFTDDDCRPYPNWAVTLERAFAEAHVGWVTGRIVPDHDTGLAVSVMLDEHPRPLGRGIDPGTAGSSANLAVRREAFDAVQGFDLALGPGARFGVAEDHDLFWRLLRAGWDGWYEPAAVVVHEQWRGRRAFLRANFLYGVGAGALAAKAWRCDPEFGRSLVKDRVWHGGARKAARHLRNGYQAGAAAALVSAAGTLVGLARTARAPLDGDRFISS